MFKKMITMFSIAVVSLGAQNIDISGTVKDKAGKAISGASVKLENTGLTATTDVDGLFSLKSGSARIDMESAPSMPHTFKAEIRHGQLSLHLPEKSLVVLTAFSLDGRMLSIVRQDLEAGTHALSPSQSGRGVYFYHLKSSRNEIVLKVYFPGGEWQAIGLPVQRYSRLTALAKETEASAFSDVLKVTKSGYVEYSMPIGNPDTSGIKIQMVEEAGDLPKFSFFVTSLKALQELSGSEDGFGGDLRFGETGAGAGLRGADKICATIAEKSMPGSSAKDWRAFLSVSEDENGNQVNAIDRVGEGPWYDRLGRMLAPTKADLLNTRPQNGHSAIQNDLPNEDGVPNQNPDGTGNVDNHHMITGSGKDGKLYTGSKNPTCNNWTSSKGDAASGKPRYGLSWPRNSGGRPGRRVNDGSANWISAHDASGCEAGIQLTEFPRTGVKGVKTIGNGGGYGGFYCFALKP